MGTLGCFVQRDGNMHLLSNNHVLAGENDARLGDRIPATGERSRSSPEQLVAELSAFVPLTFVPEGQLGMDEGVNLVDAATARLGADVNMGRCLSAPPPGQSAHPGT